MKNLVRKLFGKPQLMPLPHMFGYDELVEFCAENQLDYLVHETMQKETITTTMGGVTETYTRYGFGSMFYKDKNGGVRIVRGVGL